MSGRLADQLHQGGQSAGLYLSLVGPQKELVQAQNSGRGAMEGRCVERHLIALQGGEQQGRGVNRV